MQENQHLPNKIESVANNSMLLKEISELQRNVDILSNQNSKTLDKIQQIQHTFQYTLYQAKKVPGKQIAFKKELLLKQIDKLLQEKSLLDRKLHHFTVQQEEKGEYKNNCILRQSTQYTFLRTIWSKFQSDKPNDAIDKIQQLNKAVCTFKNNIIGITNREKTQPSIHQIINVTQKQFISLKQKYDRVNMVNEDLTGILIRKNQMISQLKNKYEMQKRETERLRLEQRKYENTVIKHKLDNAKMDQSIFRLTNQVKDLKKIIEKLQHNIRNQQEEFSNNDVQTQELANMQQKDQAIDINYLNPAQKVAINIKFQQFSRLKKGDQIHTNKTLKQIAVFLQEKKQLEGQNYCDSIKIPTLSLSQRQKSSTNDEYSQRTFTSKFISKREGGNLNCSGPRTQRKLLTTRNETLNNQESSNFASSRQKKFSRSPSNLNPALYGESDYGNTSKFVANQEEKTQEQQQVFSEYGLEIKVKQPV